MSDVLLLVPEEKIAEFSYSTTMIICNEDLPKYEQAAQAYLKAELKSERAKWVGEFINTTVKSFIDYKKEQSICYTTEYMYRCGVHDLEDFLEKTLIQELESEENNGNI